MSSLDALQADGQSHAVLTTVAKTIFTKWKKLAKGGEDITLLQLSVKDALVWTYFEVHDVIEPKYVPSSTGGMCACARGYEVRRGGMTTFGRDWPVTRHPSPATRHPPPATNYF